MLQIVEAIDALSGIQGGEPLSSSWWHLFNAKSQIEVLFDQSIYRPYLRVSRDRAKGLHSALESVLQKSSDPSALLDEREVWQVRYHRDQFRPVFLSEISTLPVFLVLPKEGYDVAHLIHNGSLLFPASIQTKAPEAMADALQAGKALAFELATSCGFHVFRVAETVLRKYWDAVSDGAERPKLQTIGSFAAELEKGEYGEAKVWETLKQFAKLHRNPIIHPEVILIVDEAIEIIGIARSVVGAMLRRLPEELPTTATA